ncbi:MAG: 7-carboxy-7-deazaguanine synthase QueE [Paenibacillus dendritiformis]|uniref:7-carboxy-7-deazaguanine synthase QueE n=1 Tax=Paenibacillus dendritiformis TaxID=130049 RepID=UPI001B23C1C9|nr:7-carboxy-7-deazaguanine synthase QueE [Paenibacillus dendritiformis]MDU5144767.1 7-carboxy-7-deazaguanine synthase QueE [Paenibacillus dendritiformis]GIO76025.1 7-carboxy-7-deazaguanine synthase [Paenibacillus dendritiformis]
MTIPVLELFGPTVQGEGMLVGRKTMFVRTAGCDYRCSWCDSAFTWDGSAKEEIRSLTAEDILRELNALAAGRFDHVTISGGNPVLIPGIGELVRLLGEHGIRTAVETQGSRWQDWLLDIDDVTLSPKPPSSGMNTDEARLDQIVSRLRDRADRKGLCLKIVVFDERDLAYAIHMHERYPDIPFVLQTGNDDVRSSDDRELIRKLLGRYEWLIDQVAADPRLNRVRVLPQLHTLVWGNRRGV